jgi:gamma-aminobutyric acid type B receptor
MAGFRIFCSTLCWCSFAFSYVRCTIPLYIGVLLPSTPNEQTYSDLLLPAVRLAVEHINESPDILPEYKIVLDLKDSGCDVGKAGYQMFELLSEESTTKVAVIGEQCSIVTQPLGLMLKYWNIPQVSYKHGTM